MVFVSAEATNGFSITHVKGWRSSVIVSRFLEKKSLPHDKKVEKRPFLSAEYFNEEAFFASKGHEKTRGGRKSDIQEMFTRSFSTASFFCRARGRRTKKAIVENQQPSWKKAFSSAVTLAPILLFALIINETRFRMLGATQINRKVKAVSVQLLQENKAIGAFIAGIPKAPSSH